MIIELPMFYNADEYSYDAVLFYFSKFCISSSNYSSSKSR